VIRTAHQTDSAAIAELEALVFGTGCLLAEETLLVGYALGWMLAGEGELLRIAVRPSHRGRGLGRQLLQSFLQHPAAADAEQIFLEVRADNAPARALYERVEFTAVGRRPRYYRDGADAILYTLTRSSAC
jgi:ribosomal-protein-alanine N-acetyltransferase